mgnify:CR=1 FL=1
MAIRHLSNGEKQLLMDNVTLEKDPEKFVISSAISKNGKHVAYSWWRPHHIFDLHIFDIEKNTSKLLFGLTRCLMKRLLLPFIYFLFVAYN